MHDWWNRPAASWLGPAFCALALAGAWPRAATGVQTIALRGESPSSSEAAAFQSFSPPSLNNRGQVAFAAQLAGNAVTTANDVGYWIASAAAFEPVLREGAAAPGMPAGTLFGSPSSLFSAQVPLNEAGDVAVGISATQTSGLWVGNHESLTLVAAQGNAAPGAENGAGFAGLAGVRAALDRRGDVAFHATLNAAPYTTINTSSYTDGLWIFDRSGPVTAVLVGMGAPALGGQAQYYGFPTFSYPGLNGGGQSAFAASHKLTPGSSTIGRSLWVTSDNVVELRAAGGQSLPQIGPNATLNFIGAPEISATGAAVAQAGFINSGGSPSSGTAIVFVDSTGISLAAYTGGPAPGTAGHFFRDTFYDPSMNSRGQIAFYGSEWDGVNSATGRSGIWAGAPDDLQLIALQGTTAPGTAAMFGSFFRNTPSINRFGQIAWSNLLDVGPGSVSNSLWATSLDGQVTKIARDGEGLEVAPGDVRTISSLSLVTNHGDDDGRPRSLNDLGQIVFSASFTDGTTGIFLSNAVAHLPGDYNQDHIVDAADYIVWRKSVATQNLVADGDRDGVVGAGDFEIVREFFGLSLDLPASGVAVTVVPEVGVTLLWAMVCAAARRRRGN